MPTKASEPVREHGDESKWRCREIGLAHAPHRDVADTGFGFRHLARSRSSQPLIDVPAQPAAVHLYHTLRA